MSHAAVLDQEPELIEIGPQAGPQTLFIETEADIAVYGGAAGGGKTFGLLLDPLRHYDNAEFGGVIFRKTSVQVRNEGGLWDESVKLYSLLHGLSSESSLSWKFPSGSSMGFGHLEYDKDVQNWQGAQIPWIGFDELTHFSRNQFFYMLSRNRSTSGVRPCIRATCNPDPDSWVREFIDWWIGDDGFPVPERAGALRWFVRFNDELIWADTAEELYARYGEGKEVQPKSVTFIPAKLEDNKILMDKDPHYLGNLLALNRVDRMRLRDGNWNVRAQSGDLFQREWFEIVDAIPSGFTRQIRFWDRAATRASEKNKDPDWTRGLLLYEYPSGKYLVADLRSMRDTPAKVEQLIKSTAAYDGHTVKIKSQQDPGSAGVSEAYHFATMLSGYVVETETMPKDKLTRAKPVSAQCEVGNVMVLRAPWNKEFFSELEAFPDPGQHDDIVDVLSGAFNDLSSGGLSSVDVLYNRGF